MGDGDCRIESGDRSNNENFADNSNSYFFEQYTDIDDGVSKSGSMEEQTQGNTVDEQPQQRLAKRFVFEQINGTSN